MNKVCAMPASVISENVSNGVVVSFAGAIRDADFEEQLMDQFHRMNLTEQKCVIIDLSDVIVLPSSLLGAILTLYKRIGRRLALGCVGSHLLEQMTITRLIEIFTIYDHREEAMAKMA